MDASRGVVLRTPAKLNLCLRILGLRTDGYHEILTRMQQISLYDEMRIEPGGRGVRVRVARGEVPGGRENIVHRAARALAEASGRKGLGARIHLTKNVPAGAGLGGGSANAAGAIVALNRLWNLSMPAEALGEVAARVGADVAFFLGGPAAICRGRGERVEGAPTLRSGWFLLIKPPFHLSTQEVYAWSRENLLGKGRVGGENECARRLGRHEYGNDLEAVVFPRFPQLKRLCGALVRQGAAQAMMSGSGSSVFGRFRRKTDAERAARAVGRSAAGRGCSFYLVRPLQENTFLGRK